MIQVYSYIRFSSKKQVDGDSYNRQFAGASAWLKQHADTHVLNPLKLFDEGVSAFRGRNKETGDLAKFVDLVKTGQIKKGSVLLVEHLDRLSRQGVSEALELFLGILRMGIKIVVLRPTEMEFNSNTINDLVGLLIPLVYFHLAHVESENKSFRVGKAWDAKRSQLADEPFSKKCPSWLTPKDGKFVANEGAKAIRYIFEQCSKGVGQKTILRGLVKEYAPIGRVGRWTGSYVNKVLNDKAVLGEFRPRKLNPETNKHEPTGDVFPGYYPRVISDELWARATASKAKRKKLKGRKGNHINIFQGIMFNAHDGCAMHCQTTRAKRDNGVYVQRRLVSYGHLQNLPNSDSVSVPFERFEEIALHYLDELTLDEVESENTDGLLTEKEQELSGVELQIGEIQEHLTSGTKLKALMPVLTKLEAKQTALLQEVEMLKGITPLATPLKETKNVLLTLRGATPEEAFELRLRLQGLVRDLVETIYIKPEKHFGKVYCIAQFNLRNGKFKQINFGHCVFGGSTRAEDEISWTVDLRNRKAANKKQMLKGIAELCNDFPVVPVPDIVPQLLGEASKVWLAIARNNMAKSSYRVVPAKINRFVEFMGSDLHCSMVNKSRWDKWTDSLLDAVGKGEQEAATARIIWGRSRELVRWLVNKEIIKPIVGLEQSALQLFSKSKV